MSNSLSLPHLFSFHILHLHTLSCAICSPASQRQYNKLLILRNSGSSHPVACVSSQLPSCDGWAQVLLNCNPDLRAMSLLGTCLSFSPVERVSAQKVLVHNWSMKCLRPPLGPERLLCSPQPSWKTAQGAKALTTPPDLGQVFAWHKPSPVATSSRNLIKSARRSTK